MTHIHVIHENAAWLEPLAGCARSAGASRGATGSSTAASSICRGRRPEGVFYNRMSASSHTRDHRYAAELTAAVLAWLERHGRRVVNGSRALDLEISKARQYAALEAAGIRTPDTVLVAGKELLVEAARQHFAAGPFILKPNRGGKGLGVRLFHSPDALRRLSRQPGLRAAGRRIASVAAIRPRAGTADHPRRVHRRPIHVCGRGRHQRRVRAVPGRCLRGRRRRSARPPKGPARNSRSSTISTPL